MKNEKKSFKHGKNWEFEPRSQGNENTYTQHEEILQTCYDRLKKI